MPGMDGYEVCLHLRSDPSTTILPVVMVTASGGEQRIKALEVGADDFIVKPFNQPELLARVKSLLRIKQYHERSRARRPSCCSSTVPWRNASRLRSAS